MKPPSLHTFLTIAAPLLGSLDRSEILQAQRQAVLCLHFVRKKRSVALSFAFIPFLPLTRRALCAFVYSYTKTNRLHFWVTADGFSEASPPSRLMMCFVVIEVDLKYAHDRTTIDPLVHKRYRYVFSSSLERATSNKIHLRSQKSEVFLIARTIKNKVSRGKK